MDAFALEDVEGELVASMEQPDARPADDVPFRLLLIGDWSGRENRGARASSAELKAWRPLLVDRDNLDQLVARLGVRLNVPLTNDGSQSLLITFNQLEDFHPDRLYDRLDVFESLRSLRARLSNPETFAAAAAEVRGWTEKERRVPEPENKTVAPLTETPPADDNLLDQILSGGARASSTNLSQPVEEISSEISEFARAVAEPYLSPDIEEDQDELIDAVDKRIAGTMKAILHYPDFQAIESAWRALDFLAMRLDTGTDLKLYLLDISMAEIRADLQASLPQTTALHKLLAEQTVGTRGGLPWAAIGGNFIFAPATEVDAALIESISQICQEAGAPFIAATTSHLLGCPSLNETPDPDEWQEPLSEEAEARWNKLRTLDSAAYVGLALPRFLLRLPYGADTEPTEQFDFEEVAATHDQSPRHEDYLWGNPAFALAYLLADGFSKNGWEFRPADRLEIEGLPLHVYESRGDSEIKPCAEVLLTVRAAQKIIEHGLMPLLSMKDTDTIRLGSFQSIGGSQLRGRWTL